jgi:hypothetical protein
MGNIFPTRKKAEFWHTRSNATDSLHKSVGTVTAYNDVIEYEGEALSIEDGNLSGGLNLEQWQICYIERYTKKNIFIDRIKERFLLDTALSQNKSSININTKSLNITLTNDQPDCAKVIVMDEYKSTLAVFYING